VAERTIIFVLSLLGIAAQIVGIAREYGLTAAVSALAAAAAATWLFGLGGLLDRR
jgi:hypothetical protein